MPSPQSPASLFPALSSRGRPPRPSSPAGPARLALCALALLALLVPGCSGEGPKKQAKRPIPVEAGKARVQDVPLTISAVGNVEPVATVAVKSRVGGMIVEQYVADGQDVAKGDRLFQIDPRPYELALRESRAKLEQEQARLEVAESDLTRQSGLKRQDVIAQGQLDQTVSLAKALRATVRLQQALVEQAALDLEYARVTAPIPGRVGAVRLHQGNVIKANDDRDLLVINQIQPAFVSFSIPEAALPGVMARMAQGPVRVEAAFQETLPGVALAPESGEMASVDNAVDKATGSIRLKALFRNEGKRLWPGLFVRVTVVLGTRQGAVTVPAKAVLAGTRGPYLYVIRPDGTAEARDVVLGPVAGPEVVVDRGLAPEETVVVDGQLGVAPGSAVEVKGQAPPAAPQEARP